MVEGGSSREFRFTKAMMYETPELLHALLGKLAVAVTDYLNAQIRAGAQAVQIFDSWGGALAYREYVEFSLNYMQQIVNGLIREHDGRTVPVILFTKGGGQWLPQMLATGADALGLDWTTNLATARQVVQGKVALQGNLDPNTLYGSPQRIRAAVKAMLADAYADGVPTGYVANLGHGITQWVNPEHAGVFVEAVHEFSADYMR